MTREEKLHLLESARQLDFATGLPALEQILRVILPCVQFSRPTRDRAQRVSLGWDGVRVVTRKPMVLPPPSEAELQEALAGLIEDARELV